MAGDGFTRTGAVDERLQQIITGVVERAGNAINPRKALEQVTVQFLETVTESITPAGRRIHRCRS